MRKAKLLLGLLLALACLAARAQEPDAGVRQVYVVFKTHLDIGFTDLSSKVEQRYINEFIPKAIDVAEELDREGGEARYVWTTGAWLVDAYLTQAPPEAVARLERAIDRGYIAWNAMPYTVESEAMTHDLFASALNLAQRLDRRFGRRTVAAKMTDVPGHTRGVASLLHDAGIRFLHVGANSAAAIPDIPPICLWRNTDGGEVVLMSQADYGRDGRLPDGSVLSINFTGDNHGPHTADQVRGIFRSLHERYPNARIEATTLNEVAGIAWKHRRKLPLLTAEIGDTWIYGYGSSPLRMQRYRALGRLFTEWVRDGRIDPASPEAVGFAVRLGLIAEHTWGLDVKSRLRHWVIYDVDAFEAGRTALPEFGLMEASWRELDAYVDQAIERLPESLQAEARAAAAAPAPVPAPAAGADDRAEAIEADGSCTALAGLTAGRLAYQSLSAEDYDRFMEVYLVHRAQWAIEDNSKPGLEHTCAQSALLTADAGPVETLHEGGRTLYRTQLRFPDDERVDARRLPEAVYAEYAPSADGRALEIRLTLQNKPAQRLPEAYLYSFTAEEIERILVEKLGYEVDVTDVVAGGNRRMHGLDRYVTIRTAEGRTFRIWSPDALLVAIGEPDALGYSRELPNLDGGVHFCLYDNLWGTNFQMWFGGTVTYRFRVEAL